MKKFTLGLFLLFLIVIFPGTGFSDEPAKRPAPPGPPPTLDPPEMEKSQPDPIEIEPFSVKKKEQRKEENEASNDEYIPINRVNPKYPKKAFEKNIEGYVIVQFTVDKKGKTKDWEVLEETPEGYGFGKSGLKTAKKYKYKPRFIDGEIVEVPGVRVRIIFCLAESQNSLCSR